MAVLLTIFNILQNPVPQYVLGSLPAILTIGTTPHETLLAKFLWFVRCLGCPFAGLFYFCSIESNSIEMSAYWLESKKFIRKNNKSKIEDDENDYNDDDKDEDKDDDKDDDDDDDDNEDDEKDNYNKFIEESSKNTTNKETKIVIDNKDEINIKIKGKIEQDYPRPFGHHSMKLKLNKSQKRILKDWIAEASLLDRLLLGVSAYYILVGIVAGISKAAGPCTDDKSLQDWPYIPMLFIWTLPVIYVRIRKGKVVSKVLPKRLKNRIIVVKYNTEIAKTKRNWVFVIFCVSLFLPWLAVIIAYWTPPVGFFCRSKFLMLICLIWSFSSIAAYASHIKGEKDVYGPISIMFSFFGVVVGLGLIFLSILANFNSLWVTLFGPSCYVPLKC
ncbi:hypothetical protein C2G38_2070119 [Gigaspora rosea]|uniref:Uncharacterized protein n=1 Tax=Gigaspora rosea TaxID=44941 RepID=A0A397VTR9_9GLOM|nr:hypothetical protein C2G38_2070119 [Gigaspora rosea]